MSITKEQQIAYNALIAITALKTNIKNMGIEIEVNNTFNDGKEISFDALEAVDLVVKEYAKLVFREEEGSDLNDRYN